MERHVTDLVKEYSPVVCQLEFTRSALPICPGERPFFISEQLAFQQCIRYGCAVYGYERLVCSVTAGMYGPGEHLLAGAALSGYQYRGCTVGHLHCPLFQALHFLADAVYIIKGDLVVYASHLACVACLFIIVFQQQHHTVIGYGYGGYHQPSGAPAAAADQLPVCMAFQITRRQLILREHIDYTPSRQLIPASAEQLLCGEIAGKYASFIVNRHKAVRHGFQERRKFPAALGLHQLSRYKFRHTSQEIQQAVSASLHPASLLLSERYESYYTQRLRPHLYRACDLRQFLFHRRIVHDVFSYIHTYIFYSAAQYLRVYVRRIQITALFVCPQLGCIPAGASYYLQFIIDYLSLYTYRCSYSVSHLHDRILYM